MGLLSALLRKRKKDEAPDDSYSSLIKKCLVEVKLKSDEYDLFATLYYQGHTSYRDYFKFVFDNNTSKMKKIMDAVSKKADEGCNIDFTFIRFYKDDRNYIDIPFDTFSQKRNMGISRRNNKVWNRENIKRLLVNNPKLRNFDDYLLQEKYEQFLEEQKLEAM